MSEQFTRQLARLRHRRTFTEPGQFPTSDVGGTPSGRHCRTRANTLLVMHWDEVARVGHLLRRAVVAAVILSANPALAKRGPPPAVPPVVYQGVRYEAPPSAFDNPCEQEGGCVVAFDDATGAQLWFVEVYCTQYDPNLELDVQWVYISSLSISDGHIAVTNER